MKQWHLIFLIVLLIGLIACNGSEQATPTPFPEGIITEEALNPAAALAISISDLAEDPEAHADSFVEITGRYRRLPLLVCDTDPYPAPATWQLEAEDGSLVAVGGFDSQVRSLLPDDLTMTVSGVWQQFEGPVGCGKSATNIQIWYLKASDILSPSPIVQVTLTPTGDITQIAGTDGQTAVPAPGDDGDLAPTPTLDEAGDSPGGTPTSVGTITSTPPTNSTPTFTAVSPTAGSGDDDNFTATPSATSGGEGSTSTPTASSGTVTPTSSGGGGTATPTPAALTTATRNPNDFDTIEFNDLSPETPVLELLAAEEVHLWPILFEYNGAITITAVAEPTINLVLEIIDPAEDVVQQANSGGNGELEAIVDAQLNVALDYKIRIYDLNGTEGDYCLIFSEDGGFPDTIKGRIEYGQTKQDQVEVLGIDYWCFLGADGDNVSISAASTGSAGDFVIGLYGPPDFDAIGTVFQNAEIMNVNLEEDGMYIIGILDFEAGPNGYSLTLTKN